MNLVIAGGGIKAYASIGAIRFLEKSTTFDKIAGVSAGSIIATLLAIGCNSYRIQSLYDSIDLSKYVLKYTSAMTYIKLIAKTGIYDIKEFRDSIIHTLLEEACDNGDITFEDIYNTHKKVLVISGTCINKRETHYYHYISNPSMKVKEAIAISCCVPFLFTPFSWKSNTLVDGGLLENYPLYIFNDVDLPNSKIAAVTDMGVDISDNTIGIKFTDTYFHNKADTLLNLIKCLVLTILTNNENKYMRQDYTNKTITIDTGDIESVSNFNISIEDKLTLIDRGYVAASLFNLKK